MGKNDGFQNVTVRVPDSIYGALLHDARDAERSLNGQIVHVLRRWYEGQRAVQVTDEHRLVYRVDGSVVTLLAARGHYE